MKRNLIKIYIVILSVFFATVFFNVQSYAVDTSSETVRVGYYNNELFQEGSRDGEEKSGYAYEYYRKISEYTGWKYEYIYGDFSDIYQMLLNGEVDLVAGIAYTKERSELFNYPDRTMGSENYGIVKHEGDKSITSDVKTLTGRTIGVLDSVIADILNDFLDDQKVKAKVLTYSNNDELLRAFDRSEVDLIAAEYDGTYTRNHAEVLFTFGSNDYYLVVSKNKMELLLELNRAQSQLSYEEPSFISSLREKYYAQSISSRAFSRAERNWIKDNSSVTIGYLNNFLPYSDTDSEGNVTGVVKDYIPSLFASLDLKDIEFSFIGFDNYQDMIEAINSDQVDLIFPAGGGAYYSEEDGIYLSNSLVTSIANLVYSDTYAGNTKVTFAVNENNKLQDYYIKSHYPDYSLSYYSSTEECLDAVLNGEASCTTLEGLRTNGILKRHKYHELSFRQLGYSETRSIGVKIGNEDLLKLINRGINILGDEYALDLAYEYAEDLYKFNFSDYIAYRLWILLLILLIVLGILILIFIMERGKARERLYKKAEDNAILETKARNKNIFLKNLAHDLRTPMNSINGLIDLSLHSDNQELRNQYLNSMNNYSDKVTSVINDILDISILDDENVKFERQNVNIHEIISDVRAVTATSVKEKQHIVNVRFQNIRHQYVITDKNRLEQILINILSNAISFTPTMGIIDFYISEIGAVDENKTEYEFIIRDNGIGMSPELTTTVFDPYVYEKENIEGGSEIPGFGLAITKKIVDLMKGYIKVNSVVGEGSEVIVRIPFEIGAEITLGSDKYDHEIIDKYNFYGKRILIVEDTPSNQLIVSNVMKKAGFEIQIANDGAEAYEKLNAAPSGYFDAVYMAITDHLEAYLDAVRKIRALDIPAKASIPIIAVCNRDSIKDEEEVLGCGITELFYRPLESALAMESLNKLLN